MIASAPHVPGVAPPDSAEIDAVAAVVRGCAGVSALAGGPFGEVTSYLPGRAVPGVTVDDTRIRVRVRSEWGVRATTLAELISAALAPLAGSRPVDVTIADIDDPPPVPAGAITRPADGRGSSRSAPQEVRT